MHKPNKARHNDKQARKWKFNSAITCLITTIYSALFCVPSAYAAIDIGSDFDTIMESLSGGVIFIGAVVGSYGFITLVSNIKGDNPSAGGLLQGGALLVLGITVGIVGVYWSGLDTSWVSPSF